ncbi:hypothetical protein IDAT_08625 [Pseudidiomarina atlantica]|uniref:Uncharacterized protein n=1 Tax=Pseudidiomarina atlantica TaxID=1517416 RepID=A0A094IMP9_9GAMM|nr:hypothetical protein [Pseudidiomarina atlantica]KFZ28367.1 hypothetical protein IDAT_08625 [Pseudidiomarina atlantica]
MKTLNTIGCIVILIAGSVSYAAEPPQDKKPEATAKKVGDSIEIAVEKIEREQKGPQSSVAPTDADGDGYGDVATQAQGDPIPGIDITVSQSEATQTKVPGGGAKAVMRKPRKPKTAITCTDANKDCDN